MVGFLHSLEQVHTTNWSLIGLVDGIVFNRVLFVAKDILGFSVGGLKFFGELRFGLKGVRLELGVRLDFFHDFKGELFAEGGFGFGSGGEKGVNCFHGL